MKHERNLSGRARQASDETGGWLTSSLLSEIPGLLHGFTLRNLGDLSREAGVERLLAETGAQGLGLLRQVHGVGVADPARLPGSTAPEADAWAGRPRRGTLLGILTADCLPVLLCHRQSGVLGLAHAGWRGAVAGVIPRTLKAMGVPADQVTVALGPHIGRCCYQVGDDVALRVGTGSPHLRPWERTPNRHRLDLAGLVRDQLLAVGVPEFRIEVSPWCTRCCRTLFFSYRREGSTGRMCSFLGWTP